MTEPAVSFCTTNYNCAHVLQRHLESIYSNFKESEFEYIVVDSHSKDGSYGLLLDFSKDHSNFTVVSKKCIRGIGRQLAFERSKGKFIVVVDTDTVYDRVAREFVEICKAKRPEHAVQAIFVGVYPREIWEAAGGSRDYNYGEDFELWMRIWKMGKMKWYPVRMGTNFKEPGAKDSYDYLSSRYERFEKLSRFARREYDSLRLRRFEKEDLVEIWKSNTVDLGLGELEDSFFGARRSPPLSKLPIHYARSIWQILTER